MNTKQLITAGIPTGPALDEALRLLSEARRAFGLDDRRSDTRRSARKSRATEPVPEAVEETSQPSDGSEAKPPWDPPATMALVLPAVAAKPAQYLEHPIYGKLAHMLMGSPDMVRTEPAPWRQWGGPLESEAVAQMQSACRLPVAVCGALMPDAHVGYGLPIGGVLATEGAVIPYAVGVDIACRMKLTVLDIPLKQLDKRRDRLRGALEQETRFGIGAAFRDRRQHPVMDRDWSVSAVTRQLKDKAWAQLGTSGSGNHFVEFGRLLLREPLQGLPPGEYLALLSHSGSRGTGAMVCQHYSRLAIEKCPTLPSGMRRLAWLDLKEEAGQEYWAAMNLMGEYAAANHACIHQAIREHLGTDVLLDVENHHNFAWLETHERDGVKKEWVVHRKGATPAGRGVLGVIPGSMAAPGFLVRGLGNPESIDSASHGAGRAMSRTRANQAFTWSKVLPLLKERGVELISAGLDEVPMAYKDIHEVMAAQSDLVEVLGEFQPRLVKMAPAGERPED